MIVFYKFYLPAILYALLIFFLSSLPSYPIPSIGIEMEDLFLHFIEYSIFGFLLARAFIQSSNKISWKISLVIILIGILYAASDEFHQSFVEGRYSEFSDFLADSFGIFLGLSIFVYFHFVIRKRAVDR